MPRALWKGTLTFGGVNVPVKLYSAIREERTTFHLLHDKDHARLQQEMVCSLDRRPVPKENQVKGYETAPGYYVILSADELDAVQQESGRDIEVTDFVDADEIDPRFYERTYYLGPDGDAPGYAALVRALGSGKTVGVCQWLMRRRYYVGVLKANDTLLTLVTLRYADEIVSTESLDLAEAKITEREMTTAKNLVEALVGEFTPGEFRNEYETELKKIVQRKAKGEKVVLKTPKAPRPTPADDLLDTLQESVRLARERRSAA